uniref:C6 domain-containing protein n=1 Tax=Panagrolaimus sp. ES5 TaxID=591445 RepID=A0AC34F8H2_9BILA
MGLVDSCFPTSPGGTPITTTTSATITTTTVITGDCCPALIQTPTEVTFAADGNMTFTYNDDTCRSAATIFCGQPNNVPGLELRPAIVANRINYMTTGDVAETITFPATCVNGIWQVGEPPLNVVTIECQLADPPQN